MALIQNEGNQLEKIPEQYWFDTLVGSLKYAQVLPKGTELILGDNYLQFSVPETKKIYRLKLQEVKKTGKKPPKK